MGSVNLFSGTLEGGGAAPVFRSPDLGEVTLPASIEGAAAGPAEIAFRPHAIALAPGNVAPPPGSLGLTGVVEDGEFLGEFMRYDIRVGRTLVMADQPHAWGGERLAAGSPVTLCVPAHEVRVIR